MIELHVLGPPFVVAPAGTEAESVLRQRKRFALFVYLALDRTPDAYGWSELASVFWPGVEGRRARNSLRQALHFLRRHLGNSVIVRSRDHSVSVDPAAVSTDVGRFREAAASEQWKKALSLYTGDFMSGFALPLTEPFDAWVLAQRRVLRQTAATCARRLADDSEVQGDLNAATRWWRQAVALSPSDPALMQQLSESLSQSADSPSAFAALERFERQLWPLTSQHLSVELLNLVRRTLQSEVEHRDEHGATRKAPPTGES